MGGVARCGHVGMEALVVLAACGTAIEMGSHTRQCGRGIDAAELCVDESVEAVEAFVAAHLGFGGAEQAGDERLRWIRRG